MAQARLSTTGFIVPQLQENPVVKKEEPATHSGTAKAKAKAKAKPKAKSTARRTRVARQPPALAAFQRARKAMLSKRPPVVKNPKEASSPEPAERPEAAGPKPERAASGSPPQPQPPDGAGGGGQKPEGVKPELAAGRSSPQDSKQQLILNMDKGGSMRLDDPRTVRRKDWKGPDVGGDFSKARNSKRTRCFLRDFRSHAYMYRAVWQGRWKKTSGGLSKDDLTVSITGKIVPKRKSSHCRKIGTDNGWVDHWRLWTRATRDARDALGANGFLKVKKNGTDDEMALFSCTMTNYASSKKRRSPVPEPSRVPEPLVPEPA